MRAYVSKRRNSADSGFVIGSGSTKPGSSRNSGMRRASSSTPEMGRSQSRSGPSVAVAERAICTHG